MRAFQDPRGIGCPIRAKAIQTRRLTMGVADGIVEADGEVIYEVKDMKVALSES